MSDNVTAQKPTAQNLGKSNNSGRTTNGGSRPENPNHIGNEMKNMVHGSSSLAPKPKMIKYRITKGFK
jgi:hypothetical protein